MISVITINYNTPRETMRALRTLAKSNPDFLYEYIVVDNASHAKIDHKNLAGINAVYIENSVNYGFATAVSQGIAKARGEYILLLNSDLFAKEKMVATLLQSFVQYSHAGIAAPQLLHANGDVQISFGKFPTFWRELFRFLHVGHWLPFGTLMYQNIFTKRMFKTTSSIDWASGACLIIKREVIDNVHDVDKNYFFGVEDMDFCFQAKKAGFQTVYVPRAVATHLQGYSSKGVRTPWRLMQAKNGMDYFFKKNYPEKIITRLSVRLLYTLYIFLNSFRKSENHENIAD